MHEIALVGCASTPLASYLKALGVLRLLSEQQTNHQFKGSWRNGVFVLQSSSFSGEHEHDREIVCSFFLNEYRPSPLVTPWNGRGGFLEGEDEDGEESSRAGAQMVRLFSADSTADRFSSLSRVLKLIADLPPVARLNSTRAKLKGLRANKRYKRNRTLTDEEKDEIARQERTVRADKSALLQELRNQLPDEILDWFDACMVLTNKAPEAQTKKAIPVPLLGAGGLDGSMDFGVNYLRRINDIFVPDSGKPRQDSEAWLSSALFGGATTGLISTSPQDRKKVSVGQLNPANAGGSNAGAGFSGSALLNPWETLLQLEGAVLFSASATRRLQGAGDIYASLPFTVAPFAVGEAVAISDESPKGAKRRTAEMWVPLWDHPATLQELEAIFKEGRLTLQGKSVQNAFDLVRAIGSLGVSRGITAFRRISFLKRSGDAFFALDMGHFYVRQSMYSGLIDEIETDHFLSKLHSYVRSKTPSGEWRAGGKLRGLSGRLDAELVRALRTDNRRPLLDALVLLGEIQSCLSTSHRAQESVPSVPRLSERWVSATDDGTAAFHVARALAGLVGTQDVPLPVRAQLFPVHPRSNRWMKEACKDKGAADDPACRLRIQTDSKGNLVDTLIALLGRRLWLAEQFKLSDKPLQSPAGISLDDLFAFLRNDQLDRRIAALMPALSLCSIPRDTEREAEESTVPAAFALLKLCMTADASLRNLNLLHKNDNLPVPPGLLAKLAAGNIDNGAVRLSWRRLRASGLSPVFIPGALPELGDIDPRRATAALLIPLRLGATGALGRTVLETRGTEAA